MKRLSLISLSLVLLTQWVSVTAYSLNPCDEWALTSEQKIEMIQAELIHARQNIDNPFVRTYSKILGKRYERRFLEACVKKGSCTREEVAQTIREELEGLAKNIFIWERNFTRIRVYTTLSSGMIGAVLAYQYADKNTQIKMNPALAAALGGLLGTVGITTLYSLSAPLLENIQAKVTQQIYSKIGGARNSRIVSDDAFLRKYYEAYEGHYDRIEQKGGGRLMSYMKSVESTFEKITEANYSEFLTPEVIQETTANRLAYFLRTVKDFYQDIPPDDLHVMDTVYTFYGKYAKNPEEKKELYKKTIEILKQDDPAFDRSPELQSFYHRYLKTWLGVSID